MGLYVGGITLHRTVVTADQSTPAEAADGTIREPADPADAPIRVLLVDDDEDFIALASMLLEAESDVIETRTETNPQVALAGLEETAVDCIVSDYRMPELNGIEFLSAVRKQHPELPFILFTGKGDEQVAKRAISADVSDYIVKTGSAEQYAISANRIENLVTQYRAGRAAAHRQTLETLSQTVLETVLTESTRKGIEQGVVDRLVERDLYGAAVIAEPAAHSDSLTTRAEAGELFDAAADRTESIEARALDSGNPQVEAVAERENEWATAAATTGFVTAVGLPISYEEVPYGVLGVYTARSVDAEEVAMLRTLAELTAFAIGASERRRGDASRQVVEIEFDADGSSLPVVDIAETFGCGVAHTQTTNRADGTTLTLYKLDDADEMAVDSIEDVLNAESVTLTTSEQRSELAVVSAEPWLPAELQQYGFSINTAAVDEDGARLVVELPASVDVRAVVEAIETRYPRVEPVARRQRTRADRSVGELHDEVVDVLTDRQQEVIETAFRAGYYEWPHKVSSKTVAKRLGISQPTFAEHFWTAHRRIVDRLFDPESDTDRRQSDR